MKDTFVADLLADAEAEFSAMEEAENVFGGINKMHPRHPNDHTTSLVLRSQQSWNQRDCFFVGNSV